MVVNNIRMIFKYLTEFLRNRFNYESNEFCKIRKNLERINSSENSSFSSIMQNMHAVEHCLEESDFLMCENG